MQVKAHVEFLTFINFFLKDPEHCPAFINKQIEFYNLLSCTRSASKTGKSPSSRLLVGAEKKTQNDYSQIDVPTREARVLAPAMIESLASSHRPSKRRSIVALSPWKILLFRSRHIVQITRMINEYRPRELGGGASDSPWNHDWMSSDFQLEGWRPRQEDHAATFAQRAREYGHSVIIWLTVFRFLIQSGQKYSLGQPRWRSLSVVQILFWSNSQRKNLHLEGAHGFQVSGAQADGVIPSNCIS